MSPGEASQRRSFSGYEHPHGGLIFLEHVYFQKARPKIFPHMMDIPTSWRP